MYVNHSYFLSVPLGRIPAEKAKHIRHVLWQ